MLVVLLVSCAVLMDVVIPAKMLSPVSISGMEHTLCVFWVGGWLRCEGEAWKIIADDYRRGSEAIPKLIQSSELPLTIVATKNSKLSEKKFGLNGPTKWSNIFSRLSKIILANMVRPFWPPQKLLDFATVVMVWLNLPAKFRTEF